MRAHVSQDKINAVKHSAVDQGSGECSSFKGRRLLAGRWRDIVIVIIGITRTSSTIFDQGLKRASSMILLTRLHYTKDRAGSCKGE